LQANLAGDDLLQREIDLGGDVADQGDGASLAGAVDGGGNGLVGAYGLEDEIDAAARGVVMDGLEEGFAGSVEGCVGSEGLGQGEAGGVDVGDEDRAGSGGAGGLQEEEADHAGADDEDGVTGFEVGDGYAVESDGYGFEHGGVGEREGVGQVVGDAGGDGEVLGEGAGAAELGAGDSDDLAVVAEVDLACAAEGAGSAEDGGVEGDTVAGGEGGDGGADGGDGSGGFVAHDDGWDAPAGGAVEAVNVGAADAAGGDLDKELVGRGSGGGEIGEFEVVVLGEEESLHVPRLPAFGRIGPAFRFLILVQRGRGLYGGWQMSLWRIWG
jgi:hypothetical protein